MAASRARLNICSKGTFDTPERDLFCCELFGWRFSSAVSGTADPYVIPEAGAMAGDKKGCTRSLTWGLLGDLGPMFGFKPAEAGESAGKEKSGHYLCTLEIHWSTQEIP